MPTLTAPSVVHTVQPKDSLCWATCIYMCLSAFKDPKYFKDMSPQGIAARALYDDKATVNRAVWDVKILPTIQDYDQKYSQVKAMATWDQIKASIAQNRPVILSFDWPQGAGGHCIVVSGYDDSHGAKNVVIDDPLDPASKTMSYDDLAAGRYDGGIENIISYLAK